MADKYLNQTDLQEIADWGYDQFTQKTQFQELADEVAEIISEGGEPNVIETVSVNGTNVPPTNKNIALTIPTATSDLTNDGDGESNFATESYVDENGGKIDVIKVNGTAQTITNKEVDLSIATKVSDLTNDSGYQTASDVSTSISTALANSGNPYQTASDVSSAISSAVSSAYKYKGSVATVSDLPVSADNGDVYDVQATGMNYAWNGTEWDPLGQYVDTSVLWTSTSGQSNSLIAMTVQEVRAILYPSNSGN